MMLIWPEMLLIGAGARHVGKTELACEIIRAHSPRMVINAAKITVIAETEGRCPRGGAGCGVCALEEPFRVEKEMGTNAGKDTARMLGAGANSVYWLLVHRAHLAAGLQALREHLPHGVPVVCESNRARHGLVPGIFAVIRLPEPSELKASCASVIGMADAILTFRDMAWDLSPSQFRYANGAWNFASDKGV